MIINQSSNNDRNYKCILFQRFRVITKKKPHQSGQRNAINSDIDFVKICIPLATTLFINNDQIYSG